MAKGDVNLSIVGDAAGLLAALGLATEKTEAAAKQMQSSMQSVVSAFQKVQSAALALTAVIGGGALFGRMIEDSKKATDDSINLGKQLGVSASTASEYGVAIAGVGGNADDFGHAIQTLTRQVKTHEGALNDMGITTRDAGGHLRDMNDVFFDAVNVVNSYAAGMDRDLAAQTAFGRGASASSAIFRLTKKDMEEAKISAAELGLVVGKQNVADFEENRKATAGARQVLQGLGRAITDALLPVLSELAEWFRSVGPAAIGIVRTAVANVTAVFWGLDVSVTMVWETIKAMVISVVGPLMSLGKAVNDALHGNFAQAKADLAEIGPALTAAWGDAFDKIVAKAQLANEKMRQAFTDPIGDAAKPKEGQKFNKADPTKENTAKESGRYAAMEIAEANQVLDELKRVAIAEAEAHEEAKLGELAVSEAALQGQLKDGRLSASQFLAQENDLITQRLEAQRAFYAKRTGLAVGDEAEQARIQVELTKAEEKALKERQVAENQAHTQQMAQWRQLGNQMEHSFEANLKGMLNGTKTFGSAVRNIFATMVDGILGIFVKMAVTWAENMITQQVLGKTAAASQITANASMAAVAAMASVAAIPIVGWAMAPAVGAATEAEGLAYLAGLSAEGGFDVPRGVNPVTQLHQREMVLPANLADTIRGLAANGGAQGGSGGDVHVHVSAWDSRSVDQWLRSGGDKQIAAAMARQYSQFNPNLRGNR